MYLLLYLIAEVAAVWAVGSAVGFGWTILLLLAGAFVGSWLARREGGKAMTAFLGAARAGKSGHREVTDGMLIALGGLLILVPGFVTDVVGLLLLLPPTRALFRRRWQRKLEQAAPMGAFPRVQRVVVVDGEVVTPHPRPVPRQPQVIEGRVADDDGRP